MDYRAQYDERKAQVLNILDKSIKFYSDQNDAEKTASLVDLQNAVKNGTFSIVVVGQFSAGKSTFLNALMGEKYLPSFTTETTATINFLRSVKESPTGKPLIKVNYKDGTVRQEDNVNLENIEKYVSTKGDNVAKTVSSVEVYLDSKYLNDGVSLVDSPGLNGVLEGHEQITNEQINRSHAAIFMFNAKQPGSKTDFEKLKMLNDRCDSVLIVLNQKDLVKKEEQSIENVVQTVKENYAKYFGTNKLPEIFPISAYQALVARSKRNLDYNGKSNYSESEKQGILSDSDMEVFEERLNKYLTQGEKTRNTLLSPIERVCAFLNETDASINNQIEILSNTTDADEVREQINHLKDEYEGISKKLNESGASIRSKVGDILRDAEREVKAAAADAKNDCLSKIEDAEELEEFIDNAQLYINRVCSKYDQILEDARSKAEHRYRDLIASEYNEHAQSIEERLTAEGNGAAAIEFPRISLDGSQFEVETDIDDYLNQRNEMLKNIDDCYKRLDSVQMEVIKSKNDEAKRQKLERSIERSRENRSLDIQSLGERPDVETYTDYETRKKGGLGGFWKWITTGTRKYDVPVTKRDYSAQEEYDEQKREVMAQYEREQEQLSAQLEAIPVTDQESLTIKRQQIERARDRQEKALDMLEEERRSKVEKARRKEVRKARTYVEDTISDIEKESLGKIYEQLRNSKESMSNALLDVLQMKLSSELSRKKEEAEALEKKLSLSQEGKAQEVANLNNAKSTLKAILQEAEGCCAEISSIKTDKIKIS